MKSKTKATSIVKNHFSHFNKTRGSLLIIGGREDKTGDRRILQTVVDHARDSKLVVATLASQIAMEVWQDYRRIFHEMGVKNVAHLRIENPEQARSAECLRVLDHTRTVFFTGGDQLKITTKIGGTPVLDRIFQIFNNGGLIAGTSAGAAMMGETMLVGGEVTESHRVGEWMMAPGIGFVHNMIVDQHFAQRGRIGRLLRAVALNPGVLGIGVDEDTAVLVQNDEMKVIGTNAVYVVDGRHLSYTNVSEAAANRTMSMHDVRLHILAENELFYLKTRSPQSPTEMSQEARKARSRSESTASI